MEGRPSHATSMIAAAWLTSLMLQMNDYCRNSHDFLQQFPQQFLQHFLQQLIKPIVCLEVKKTFLCSSKSYFSFKFGPTVNSVQNFGAKKLV